MPEVPKVPRWWQTIPGVLTAVAGIITAFTGLLVTLNQAGVFKGQEKPALQSDNPTREPRQATGPSERSSPPHKAGILGRKSGVEIEEGAETTSAPGTAVVIDNPPPLPPQLRRTPEKLSPGAATALVVRMGFHEARRNPTGRGPDHRYRIEPIGDCVVVVDDALGLMWERDGAGPMTFGEARIYPDRLNAERRAGYGDWRLPTVEEAMALVEPTPAQDGFSFDPAFDRHANYVWISDQATDDRAWMVRYHGAELVQEPVEFNAMVRAVRSLRG